jgi:hypothetical protein
MSKHNTFRKVIAAMAISSAIGLTSLVGGAASADGPSSSGKMVNVYSYILTNSTVANTGPSQQAGGPIEEVAFYYNRIAFNYAASK